jgi:FkbM family methyltransferase
MAHTVRSVFARLRRERHPVRFLLSRVLLRTGTDLPFTLTFSKTHNVKTYLHASSAAQKLFAGKYHPHTDIAVFERFVQPGGCVLDIGANIGMFTTLAARLAGEQGRVYAFEPTYSSFRYLLENLELNQVRTVVPVFGAVTDQGSEVYLHDHTYSKEQNYIARTAEAGTLVPAYQLDTFLAQTPHTTINFVKIDVEGAELLVLRSLGARIRDVAVLYLEFVNANYEAFGYRQADLLRFLQDNHFTMYAVTHDANGLHCTPLVNSDVPAGQNIIASRTPLTAA